MKNGLNDVVNVMAGELMNELIEENMGLYFSVGVISTILVFFVLIIGVVRLLMFFFIQKKK